MDEETPRRRSVRLRGFDYTAPGGYFVTIVTQDRALLFGEIIDDEMRANAAGRMICDAWHAIPDHYPGVQIDAFALMPNHIHGIIILTSDDPVGAAPRGRPADPRRSRQARGQSGQARGPAPTSLSLPDVVQRYKSLTTARYIAGVKQFGWPRFAGRLWQRNYYEHIIRNDQALDQIREYIAGNPARWADDAENPAVGSP